MSKNLEVSLEPHEGIQQTTIMGLDWFYLKIMVASRSYTSLKWIHVSKVERAQFLHTQRLGRNQEMDRGDEDTNFEPISASFFLSFFLLSPDATRS